MATSSTYSETRTALQLITDAHIALGVQDVNNSLKSAWATVGIRALNDLLYQLKGPPNFLLKGLRIWQRERQSLTLDSSKYSYSLKSSGGDCDIQIPEEIIHVVLRHTSSVSDVTMPKMSFREYQNLSSKQSSGTPSKWFYEKGLSAGTLFLNCKPTATIASGYTVEFVYRQPIEIITATTQEFDLPDYYFKYIKFQLALDLTPNFTITREKFDQIRMLRDEALMLAQTPEPDDTDYYFEPGKD